ncbi:hypothetical protein GCM10025876_32750 [Demequina litorisediminis]|uniref:Uncharacterized protein n=1 Tax=Demequina litorisediminis TaxID=1849022 RepID=A0ABQ6II59_9MICO|nr:hypothetical protein GCM10025876_32750 [Demequina litorisediminis]
MVFQSFNLFAHKTILENVTLGPMKVRGIAKATAREEAMALLERVGVANQADKYPAQALRRAAAARRHRTIARHASQGDAFRRAHVRAGPRDDQ